MYGRKRGRPKKEDSSKKTRTFMYRMTDKQFKTLHDLAASNGFRTITAYLDKVLDDEVDRSLRNYWDNL